MLGLILLYFIGKKYYELAGEYDKSQWLYAVLGVVSYYVGGLSVLFLFALVYEFTSPGAITGNEHSYSLLIIPFGLLSTYLVYRFLNKKWEREKPKVDSDIEQIGNNN